MLSLNAGNVRVFEEQVTFVAISLHSMCNDVSPRNTAFSNISASCWGVDVLETLFSLPIATLHVFEGAEIGNPLGQCPGASGAPPSEGARLQERGLLGGAVLGGGNASIRCGGLEIFHRVPAPRHESSQRPVHPPQLYQLSR